MSLRLIYLDVNHWEYRAFYSDVLKMLSHLIN
jgi:hypothetical protein